MTCGECDGVLYPEEVERGTCNRCEQDRLEARQDEEPDGEAFRGGEAAAWEREQQFEALKLK